jgi:hypothetical protein
MRERGSVSSICEQIARAATRLLRNLVADSGEQMEREEQRKLAAESPRYAERGGPGAQGSRLSDDRAVTRVGVIRVE